MTDVHEIVHRWYGLRDRVIAGGPGSDYVEGIDQLTSELAADQSKWARVLDYRMRLDAIQDRIDVDVDEGIAELETLLDIRETNTRDYYTHPFNNGPNMLKLAAGDIVVVQALSDTASDADIDRALEVADRVFTTRDDRRHLRIAAHSLRNQSEEVLALMAEPKGYLPDLDELEGANPRQTAEWFWRHTLVFYAYRNLNMLDELDALVEKVNQAPIRTHYQPAATHAESLLPLANHIPVERSDARAQEALTQALENNLAQPLVQIATFLLLRGEHQQAFDLVNHAWPLIDSSRRDRSYLDLYPFFREATERGHGAQLMPAFDTTCEQLAERFEPVARERAAHKDSQHGNSILTDALNTPFPNLG